MVHTLDDIIYRSLLFINFIPEILRQPSTAGSLLVFLLFSRWQLGLFIPILDIFCMSSTYLMSLLDLFHPSNWRFWHYLVSMATLLFSTCCLFSSFQPSLRPEAINSLRGNTYSHQTTHFGPPKSSDVVESLLYANDIKVYAGSRYTEAALT